MPQASVAFDTLPMPGEPAVAVAPKPKTLRCVVMHAGDVLPAALGKALKRNRHRFEVVTASSIAETKGILDASEVDLLLLSQNMPDGDGVAFARSLVVDPRTCAVPVIMISDGSARARAVETLRAGAADSISVRSLTPEIFDQAIANALRRSGTESAGQLAQISNLEAENAALRRVTLRNMRLLKREVLPLLAFAWNARGVGGPDAPVSGERALKLSQVTREVLGLIDDTVITSGTSRALDAPEPVDLGDVARRVLEEDCGEISLSSAHFRIGRLPLLLVSKPLIAMMFEELFVNAVRNARLGFVPEITVSADEDADGNVVIRLTETGIPLSSRKQAIAAQFAESRNRESAGEDGFSWSLCQRLAEKNGATFRISEAETGEVQIALRFPRRLAVGMCAGRPDR